MGLVFASAEGDEAGIPRDETDTCHFLDIKGVGRLTQAMRLGPCCQHSVEVPRARQDSDITRVAVWRKSRGLGVRDNVGAGQLDFGLMIL